MSFDTVGSINNLRNSVHTGNNRFSSSAIDIKPSDWRIIREQVALASVPVDSDTAIEWKNEVTGASGSIHPITESRTTKGRLCRAFETTVNTVGGVRQYSGSSCLLKTGDWALLNIKPRDEIYVR